MDIYSKTARLANRFESVYPSELPERLRWWRTALGIDRTRLLRLIGLSARQAALARAKELKDVLEDAAVRQRAWLLEGSLVRLLSLYRYDWRALAEQLHRPGALPHADEPSRTARRAAEVAPLRHAPSGAAPDLLIDRLAEGGPDSLSGLLAYLAESRNGAGKTEES